MQRSEQKSRGSIRTGQTAESSMASGFLTEGKEWPLPSRCEGARQISLLFRSANSSGLSLWVEAALFAESREGSGGHRLRADIS